MFAARFDLGKLAIQGTPVAVLDDVESEQTTAPAPFDISRNGTLVYVPGKADAAKFPLAWMQADGATRQILPENSYLAPAFSPDGKRLAYSLRSERGVDIWVYDLERETPAQLTFGAVRSLGPEIAWTPDGRHIVYSGESGGKPAILWIRSDGSGQPYPLLADGAGGRPHSFSPDGRTLAYTVGTYGLPDIWTVSVDASDPEHPKAGKPTQYLATPNVEVDPMFSPDGRWIAYASSESGREELFVRPFPPNRNGGAKVRVSSDGGKFPSWSRNGRELFFLGGDDRIMVATYATKGEGIEVSKPRPWSETPIVRTLVYRNLDLHPDGKRFVMFPLKPEDRLRREPNQVTVILNFAEELKRLTP
jgi:serine/threonine-protein kinase